MSVLFLGFFDIVIFLEETKQKTKWFTSPNEKRPSAVFAALRFFSCCNPKKLETLAMKRKTYFMSKLLVLILLNPLQHSNESFFKDKSVWNDNSWQEVSIFMIWKNVPEFVLTRYFVIFNTGSRIFFLKAYFPPFLVGECVSKNKETQTQTQTQELKTATIRSKREEIIKDVFISAKAESANGGFIFCCATIY